MAVWPNNFDQMIVLNFLMHLIVQCAYPKKDTPLPVWQRGYPGPSLLRNMY